MPPKCPHCGSIYPPSVTRQTAKVFDAGRSTDVTFFLVTCGDLQNCSAILGVLPA